MRDDVVLWVALGALVAAQAIIATYTVIAVHWLSVIAQCIRRGRVG